MKPKHTPGPWTTDQWDGMTVMYPTGDRTYRFVAITDSEHDTGRTDPTSRAEDEANARLIAAAPELLEAAKLAFATFPKPGTPAMSRIAMLLEQAIAKAEGRDK